MKYLKLFLVTLLFFSFLVIANAKDRSVEAIGTAYYEDNNISKAYSDALIDAQVNAIAQGCGVNLSSVVTGKDFTYVTEVLKTNTTGRILTYEEIKREKIDNNNVSITIKATVSNSDPKAEMVNTTGFCLIENNNMADAQKAAFTEAKKQAVERVCGVDFKAQTNAKNFTEIDEIMQSYTQGYISEYDVLEEKTENGNYCVKIKAYVKKINKDIQNIKTEENIENKYCKIEKDVLIGYTGHEKVVKIPNGVYSIEADVFYNNKDIEEVILPNSIVSIGNGAFRDCKNLRKINLVDSISFIGAKCFSDCSSLENVNIPKSLNSIEEYCFENCINLTSVNINNVKIIKYGAFEYCYNLSNIILNKVEKIEHSAFSCKEKNPNISLKKLVIPSSVEDMGNGVFQCYSNIEELIIEDGVKDIGSNTFKNAETAPNKSLKKLVIPSSVDSAYKDTFKYYEGLENVYISVKTYTNGYFEYSPNVKIEYIDCELNIYGIEKADKKIFDEIKNKLYEIDKNVTKVEGEIREEWYTFYITASNISQFIQKLKDLDINGETLFITSVDKENKISSELVKKENLLYANYKSFENAKNYMISFSCSRDELEGFKNFLIEKDSKLIVIKSNFFSSNNQHMSSYIISGTDINELINILNSFAVNDKKLKVISYKDRNIDCNLANEGLTYINGEPDKNCINYHCSFSYCDTKTAYIIKDKFLEFDNEIVTLTYKELDSSCAFEIYTKSKKDYEKFIKNLKIDNKIVNYQSTIKSEDYKLKVDQYFIGAIITNSYNDGSKEIFVYTSCEDKEKRKKLNKNLESIIKKKDTKLISSEIVENEFYTMVKIRTKTNINNLGNLLKNTPFMNKYLDIYSISDPYLSFIEVDKYVEGGKWITVIYSNYKNNIKDAEAKEYLKTFNSWKEITNSILINSNSIYSYDLKTTLSIEELGEKLKNFKIHNLTPKVTIENGYITVDVNYP